MDGPRTDDGVVVVHIGTDLAEAVGAAGLPGIWGVGAVAWAEEDTDMPTVTDVTRATIPSTRRANGATAMGSGPCPVHTFRSACVRLT